MRTLLVLLILIGSVHYGMEPLAQWWPDPAYTYRALFYAAQGLKGCLLWALIAILMPRRKYFTAAVFAVCAWGFLEDFQVVACRIGRGFEKEAASLPWQGICTGLTDIPLYWIGPMLGVLAGTLLEIAIRRKYA